MALSKRDLLKGLAATATVGTLTPLEAQAGGLSGPGLYEALSAGISNARSARAIGRFALDRALMPNCETDVRKLLEMSLRRDPARIVDREELWRGMAQAVRDDFAAGRTVAVDGWVLARTEVAACVLFELMSPKA